MSGTADERRRGDEEAGHEVPPPASKSPDCQTAYQSAHTRAETSTAETAVAEYSADSTMTQPADAEKLSANPAWYTPKRLMALFCAILFLVYFDVGVFASNGVNGSPRTAEEPLGTGFQGAFDLTYFEDGLLAAMFLAGLMIASVVLTELSAFINAFRLIGLGMSVWTLAVIWTGFSQNYMMMLFARIFVGAGEASIITLSAPFIDDIAPPQHKTAWFALLTLFPSLGVAVGYIAGSAIADASTWRVPFFAEAALGLPIVLFTLLMPPVSLRAALAIESGMESDAKAGWTSKLGGGVRKVWADARIMFRHPVFVFNNFGYAPIQACLGAFTYWGPRATKELFNQPQATVDTTIGGMVVLSAVIGTIGGGMLLDRLGSSLTNAFWLCLASVIVALVAILVDFAFVTSFPLFCAVLALGMVGLFVPTAPLYGVSMWSIPAAQRPASQAMLVVTMHLLGDVPSPPAIGAMQGRWGNWRLSLGSLCVVLAIAAALYGAGVWASRSAVDYRYQDNNWGGREELISDDSICDESSPVLAGRQDRQVPASEAGDAAA